MNNLGILSKWLSKPTVPVITIRGIIDTKQAQKVENALKRINTHTAKALALVICSPGGSPAQCEVISSKVKQYCEHNKLPLYTFADDIAASGGYFLLSIGDKVYVDSTSLVGSIGVIFSWMGFKQFMDDKKIEYRKFTTNDKLLENIFDSFERLNETHKDYIKKIGDQIHSKFINHVETHRKNTLKVKKEERDKTIYNADIFLGQKAVEYGLADGVGNYQSVLFNEFPNAQLDFVTRKTFKERFGKQRRVQISLKGLQDNLHEVQQESIQKQMMAEFLKSQI